MDLGMESPTKSITSKEILRRASSREPLRDVILRKRISQKGSSGGPFRRDICSRDEISLGKNTSGRDPQMVILQKGYFEDKSNSEQISTIKLLEGG